MVDDKRIAVTPAYQIAALKPEEQALLVETIESEQATPSVSQAQRMKKLSQSGELNEDTMLSIMSAEKKPEVDKIVLTGDTLRKYFPRSYTPRKIEESRRRKVRSTPFPPAAKTPFAPLPLLSPANPLRWASPGVKREAPPSAHHRA